MWISAKRPFRCSISAAAAVMSSRKTHSMKTSRSNYLANLSAILALAAAASIVPLARAAIGGPYTPDANTLHLYHLDEGAVPSPDAAAGGNNLQGLLNGATLGNPSFTGFGNAVNTLDGGQDLIAAANKDAAITPSAASPPGNVAFPYSNPSSGAFTMEAIVWIGFDPAKNLGTTANGGNNRNAFCQIMSCESTVNANRIFQFRICPRGVAPGGTGNPATAPQPLVTFENVRAIDGQQQATIFASIPTNGPNAIVSNQWYHVAVSYNGIPNTVDNIKFYWTLLDPSRTNVDQIPITSANTMLNGVNPLGTANTPFTIGNIARNIATAGANFLGFIDEVRISKIERATNGMLFSQPEPLILTPPTSVITVPDNPVAFNVIASGAAALAYQWRHSGTNLPGATTDTLSLSAVQFANAGDYDVVITNAFGAVTSAPVSLTVRVPIDLTWIGTAGGAWESTLTNWDANADTIADTAYTQGDNVTFDSAGSAVPVITLTNPITPHSMTVNANTDYTLTTTGGGTIGGVSRLVKSGSGTLILDVDAPFVGPSTIQSGTVQLGNASTRGSLGTGPVTNNTSLIVSRSGALTFTNFYVGSGSLTNNGTNTITMSGTNLSSGPVTLNAGALVLAGPASKGAVTQYVLNATANATASTRLTVGGGQTFGPGVSMSFLGTSLSPDYRCSLTSSDSTNVFNCAMDFSGDGSVTFGSDGPGATNLMQVTTALINSLGYTGQLLLRGVGNGVLTSQLNLGGKVSKTDGGVWTMTSTGNSWVATDVAGGRFRMGANNVFPSGVTVNITAATAVLDLGGFNQTINTLTGPGIVANSSTNSDSILTVSPSGASLFTGNIQDSTAGGTRKTGLTVSGGTLSLQTNNTYSGTTTITAGTLELVANGAITNSATINIADGATLSAITRNDATITISATQTLKGDGAFNVLGALTNKGTIELKLNKSGATLTNDSINSVTTMTYGGTLKLDITASPALTTSDSFKLFNAGSYQGAFANFIPATLPGGLTWDTSTLTTDGTLRIMINPVNPNPTNITFGVSGGQLALSWPSDHTGWRLQMQTNAPGLGISTNWFDVSGAPSTNAVFIPINFAGGSAFFRMVYP